MKKLYLSAIAALCGLGMNAAIVTDIISSSTVSIGDTYAQHEVTLESGATYLITAKDEGNGPQFKVGGSGIVVAESVGVVTKIEVVWGSKSNEGVVVYDSSEPYTLSDGNISGVELGTIEFVADGISSLTLNGDYPYVGMTSTAVKGKACTFQSIAITWDTEKSQDVEADPCEGLVLNEVCGDDGSLDGHEDWIEIVNPTDKEMDLSQLQVIKIDEDGVSEVIYTYPSGSTIEAGAYTALVKGVDFAAGISNVKNVTITLLGATGKVIDSFDKKAALTNNGYHVVGGSYSRIPNISGVWTSVAHCTFLMENDPELVAPVYATFGRITSAEELTNGLQFILVNEEYSMAMAAAWGTTKSGDVYQLSDQAVLEDGNAVVNMNNVALCNLEAISEGVWAILFDDVYNYLNAGRYLSCLQFKNMDYKKKVTETNGTMCQITFNAGGDAEISYGPEVGGSIKFNPKNDGTSRFFNYDPTDKPDEHLAVYIYKYLHSGDVSGVEDVRVNSTENTPAVYYNLSGVPVANPVAGNIYIRLQGNKAQKVLVR